MWKFFTCLVVASIFGGCAQTTNPVSESLDTPELDWGETTLPEPESITRPVREVAELPAAVVKIQFESQKSEGSGFVVHPRGYILTNMHVVEGEDEVLVSFDKGGEKYRAKVISRNQCDDLALLQLQTPPAENLPYLTTHRRNLNLGDEVTLLGFPQGTADITLSQGVVSKTQDQHVEAVTGLERVFETDGFLGSGSSGGPVVNEKLEIVGVSVAHAGGKQSVIPWSTVARSLPQMFKERFVHGWGFLATGEDGEFVVQEIVQGSPAEELGLRPADEILEVEGVALSEQPAQQFCRTVRENNSRDTPEVRVKRQNQLLVGQLRRRPLEYIRQISTRFWP